MNINKIIKKFIENKSETNQYLSTLFLDLLWFYINLYVEWTIFMVYMGIICINLDHADVWKYFYTNEAHSSHKVITQYNFYDNYYFILEREERNWFNISLFNILLRLPNRSYGNVFNLWNNDFVENPRS